MCSLPAIFSKRSITASTRSRGTAFMRAMVSPSRCTSRGARCLKTSAGLLLAQRHEQDGGALQSVVVQCCRHVGRLPLWSRSGGFAVDPAAHQLRHGRRVLACQLARGLDAVGLLRCRQCRQRAGRRGQGGVAADHLVERLPGAGAGGGASTAVTAGRIRRRRSPAPPAASATGAAAERSRSISQGCCHSGGSSAGARRSRRGRAR